MMSAQLVPEAIARITDVIADNGGNIDRIRRIARYPVTAVTFEGRGAGARFHPPAPRGVGIYPVG